MTGARGDWSPRPIPQSVPERRTADPVTPTLKDLAERERQRASLVAPGGPAEDPLAAMAAPPGETPTLPGANHPIPNETACGGLGLGTDVNAGAFAAGMKKLQQNWPGLKPEERQATLRQLTNGALAKAGVPAVQFRSDVLSDALGQLNPRKWEIAIQRSDAEQPSLSDAAVGDLGDTTYHEARHAEQFFLMAQRRAGRGMSAEAIAREMSIPLGTAEQAVRASIADPARIAARVRVMADATRTVAPPGLSTIGASTLPPSTLCADALERSVYGADREAGLKARVEQHDRWIALGAARQQLQALTSQGVTGAALTQAQQVEAATRAAYAKAYDNYFGQLVEESDARSTGSLVRAHLP